MIFNNCFSSRYIYFSSLLLFLTVLCHSQDLSAQCSAGFSLTTKATPSVCQADGSITVTLTGDLTGLYGTQYWATSGSTTVKAQASNILNDLPAGTYTVYARSFCRNDASYDITQSVSNVVVGGDYKIPSVAFNISESRGSYKDCATGIIVLNASGGNGTYTFTMTKAPSGVSIGRVTPVKDGDTYTLVGDNYPAGNYQILVDDGCYSVPVAFTVREITDMPLYNNGYNGAYVYTSNSCDSVRLFLSFFDLSLDQKHLVEDGMYEMGVAPLGQMPDKWTTTPKNGYFVSVSISPYTYRDFYSDRNTMTLTVYTRLKRCPTVLSKGINAYLQHPNTFFKTVEFTKNCSSYDAGLTISQSNTLCQPLSLSVTNTDGDVVFSKPVWTSNNSINGEILITTIPSLSYGMNYIATITDRNGTKLTRAISQSNSGFNVPISYDYLDYDGYKVKYLQSTDFKLRCYPVYATIKDGSGTTVCTDTITLPNTYASCKLAYDSPYTLDIADPEGNKIVNNRSIYVESERLRLSFSYDPALMSCDSYQYIYYLEKYIYCLPATVSITDSLGAVVHTNTITDYSYHKSPPLNYGETYTYTTHFKGGIIHTTTLKRENSYPTGYTLDIYRTGSSCKEHNGGVLRITTYPKSMPAGTKITIRDPGGSETSVTLKTSAFYYDTNERSIPPGEYTVTVDLGCGTPVTFKTELKGGYGTRDFDYTSEKTCSGLRIYPKGYMTVKGDSIGTRFQLMSGPSGYDKTIIGSGQSLLLTEYGTYVLGISVNFNSYCAIKTITINNENKPIALDPSLSVAYAENEAATAYISMKAINGVAPYTYELWNKTNTQKTPVTDIITADMAVFNYGKIDSTYTVRMTDICGTSFHQQITVQSLDSLRIAYARNRFLCIGDTIHLEALTIGSDTYQWTGPQGYSALGQKVNIPDALPEMTGWYKVTATTNASGTVVTDSVFVTVYTALSSDSVTARTTTCINNAISNGLANVVSGGSGNYSYQWQSSQDGNSWADIPGATGETCIPPAQSVVGIYYYRRVTTDNCTSVNSRTMEVKVDRCSISVNPFIRGSIKK